MDTTTMSDDDHDDADDLVTCDECDRTSLRL
jgi:hypothetical protein